MERARASIDGGHPSHGEDENLLARIAAGEQAALTRLVERHGRGLRLFASRYLGNAADAEDVAQDVFVSVWKHAGRYDPGKGRATTWLYRIAANRCIDLRRWRGLRIFIGLDEAPEQPAPEPQADIGLGARQELAMVRDGLSRLPERQRMALLLRAAGDLDVPAIAAVMGTSAGSVEQLLVRARRSLRDRMQDAHAGARKPEKAGS